MNATAFAGPDRTHDVKPSTPPSLPDTLREIQDRLSQGLVPQQVIEELLPLTRSDAVTWTRRLPCWEEHDGQFPFQVIALARVISRQAMRAFDLKLSEDGRVVDGRREGERRQQLQTQPASLTFPLALGDQEMRVEYTCDYFPDRGIDLFYFVSPADPPQAHALSASGYLSQFVPHDAVEACGGPEAFATQFAEARLRGEENQFKAIFEGASLQEEQPRRSAASPPVSSPTGKQLPILGEHTAQVLAEQKPKKKTTSRPPRQGTLFEETP